MEKFKQKFGANCMGRTINMYIFKNPEFKKEFQVIKEKIKKKYSHYDVLPNFYQGSNRLEILNVEFEIKDKVGYIEIETYLSEQEATKYTDPIQIEDFFFTIYKEFFPNEIAYVNSEEELKGGYRNIFYYENKRHYFATLDNIAYDIWKMFRNYNELRKVGPKDKGVQPKI